MKFSPSILYFPEYAIMVLKASAFSSFVFAVCLCSAARNTIMKPFAKSIRRPFGTFPNAGRRLPVAWPSTSNEMSRHVPTKAPSLWFGTSCSAFMGNSPESSVRPG